MADDHQTWRLDGHTLVPYASAGVLVSECFTVDRSGRLLIAREAAPNATPPSWKVERVTPGGKTEAIAGPGARFFAGSGVDQSLGYVADLAFLPDGTLLILDSYGKQVKRIPADQL